jgi:hypothetical protein
VGRGAKETLKNPETDFEHKVTKRAKATKTSGNLRAFVTFLSFVQNPTDHCRAKVNKSALPQGQPCWRSEFLSVGDEHVGVAARRSRWLD